MTKKGPERGHRGKQKAIKKNHFAMAVQENMLDCKSMGAIDYSRKYRGVAHSFMMEPKPNPKAYHLFPQNSNQKRYRQPSPSLTFRVMFT